MLHYKVQSKLYMVSNFEFAKTASAPVIKSNQWPTQKKICWLSNGARILINQCGQCSLVWNSWIFTFYKNEAKSIFVCKLCTLRSFFNAFLFEFAETTVQMIIIANDFLLTQLKSNVVQGFFNVKINLRLIYISFSLSQRNNHFKSKKFSMIHFFSIWHKITLGQRSFKILDVFLDSVNFIVT